MKTQDWNHQKNTETGIRTELKGIKIISEDPHILVCYKPSGIATQSRRIGAPDMVSILKNYLSKKPGKTLPTEPYLAVIHRLDQPVEGVLVFAKTPFAAKELNRELTSHGFGKYYRALVSRAPGEPEAHLEHYLVKDARTNTSRICTRETPGAKLAKLSYSVVPEEALYFRQSASTEASIHSRPCELDIHLDTGRHHQIRVQLAGIGCPIIGDRKYNPEASNRHSLSYGHEKLRLCSYRLEFTHPKTRKQMRFSLL